MEKMLYTDTMINSLAVAIVQQAVEDYKKALKNNKPKKIADIEKFFKGEWCRRLLQFKCGDEIIERAKREVQKEMAEKEREEKEKGAQ